MTEWIGQRLGNYRIIRLLGHGGFADVYLGEHLHLGTQAAILGVVVYECSVLKNSLR
jgi:eukaryotic-like serine/threonine-protein kinase